MNTALIRLEHDSKARNRAFTRKWMLITVALLLGLCTPWISYSFGTDDVRPNIVFLMTDDQCSYSMGCYGTPGAQTPNLDNLASEGVTFDKYYVTTAICMGSRASVMTGLVEYRTGCNFESGPLLRKHWNRSYPVLLREAGYQVAFAGKFGIEVAEHPDEKGVLPEEDFDRWGGGPGQTHYETVKNSSISEYADEYPHSTLAYGAFGSDFIRDAAKQGRPFCLSISFKAPHHPTTPDPRFDDIYAGASFTKPGNFGREHGEHFAPQSRLGRQYERFESWHYSDDYDGVMAKYYQQVYGVDVAVGMIRDALRKHGVEKNTIVIFTSDNGFMCGSHGYASKVLPYEESSRVPMIFYDPRRAPREKPLRCDSLCGSVDIAPTILALAGVEVDDKLDGMSLLPLLDNPMEKIHESLPLMNVWGTRAVHSLAVVNQNWKYIYWPYEEDGYEPREELYHLADDPLELKELSTVVESGEKLQSMRDLYDSQVDTWKELAVDYHGYQEFGIKFDRRLTREAKRRLLEKSTQFVSERADSDELKSQLE